MTISSIVTTPARAGDDARDQEIARKALLEGRIRPLSEIIEKVKPHLPGKILGVELEVEDNGSIVYEFDVIDQSGRLMEVEVDAATGAILSIEDDD
ncbi:MAG: PepSY domain-containing protein [Rhizobiales bacterium]|nr:PepSY domain-containing protein [Hyphomicrobiales bacterium]